MPDAHRQHETVYHHPPSIHHTDVAISFFKSLCPVIITIIIYCVIFLIMDYRLKDTGEKNVNIHNNTTPISVLFSWRNWNTKILFIIMLPGLKVREILVGLKIREILVRLHPRNLPCQEIPLGPHHPDQTLSNFTGEPFPIFLNVVTLVEGTFLMVIILLFGRMIYTFITFMVFSMYYFIRLFFLIFIAIGLEIKNNVLR